MRMRHPKRAVIPPVQSTTQQPKRDESQYHNNLDNPKLHRSINSFSAHTFFSLPSSFQHSFRSLKTTHNPWSQESSSSFTVPTTVRRIFGKKFMIFTVSGPIRQLIRSLQGSTSQILLQISTGRQRKGKHPNPGHKNRHSSITAPTPFRRAFGEGGNWPQDFKDISFVSSQQQKYPGFLSQIFADLRLSRPQFAPLWLPGRSLQCFTHDGKLSQEIDKHLKKKTAQTTDQTSGRQQMNSTPPKVTLFFFKHVLQRTPRYDLGTCWSALPWFLPHLVGLCEAAMCNILVWLILTSLTPQITF